MKYYTGVGSRETPMAILDIMEGLAIKLSRDHGYVVRSGGADGADYAFYSGAYEARSEPQIEIYIPWNGFNDIFTKHSEVFLPSEFDNWEEARKIASTIHPVWDKLTPGVQRLHARNIYQVLGKDLQTPSKFLICYAKPQGDSVQGGTRTAYEVAKMHHIPCFNLYDDATLERIENYLEKK